MAPAARPARRDRRGGDALWRNGTSASGEAGVASGRPFRSRAWADTAALATRCRGSKAHGPCRARRTRSRRQRAPGRRPSGFAGRAPIGANTLFSPWPRASAGPRRVAGVAASALSAGRGGGLAGNPPDRTRNRIGTRMSCSRCQPTRSGPGALCRAAPPDARAALDRPFDLAHHSSRIPGNPLRAMAVVCNNKNHSHSHYVSTIHSTGRPPCCQNSSPASAKHA
jgi:hypothetical protein